MENSKETWRPVVGYEDSHLISNLGRVKTIKTNRILVIRDSGVVRFYCGGNKIKRSVKNLVAEAFLGFTPNNKQVVDFIDIENNLNFSIENLKVRNYFYEGRKVGIWTIDKSWSDPETNITKVKAYCPHGESKEMYYSGLNYSRCSCYITKKYTKTDLKKLKVPLTKYKGKYWFDYLIYLCKSSANNREGLRSICTIDVDYIIDTYIEQKRNSYYFGTELDLTFRDQLRKPSIDRIDNSKGYIKGNIVIATYFENTGRGDAKFKNFNIFCKQLLSE